MNSTKLQELVIKTLDEKAPGAKCPLCGTEDWDVQLGTTFLPLNIETGNTKSWNQNAISLALLVCTNCGNSHLLNLGVLLPDLRGV